MQHKDWIEDAYNTNEDRKDKIDNSKFLMLKAFMLQKKYIFFIFINFSSSNIN